MLSIMEFVGLIPWASSSVDHSFTYPVPVCVPEGYAQPAGVCDSPGNQPLATDISNACVDCFLRVDGLHGDLLPGSIPGENSPS